MSNGNPRKKLIPLYILNILQDRTDYDEHIQQKEIIDVLRKEYSIDCDRKTISRNMKYLVEAGFDIQHCNGYYLAEREFNDCEICLLIGVLMQSKYIPLNQRNELVKKLSALAGSSFKKYLNRIKDSNNHGVQNKQLFYTIEVLMQAINEKKQVKFTYNSYHSDKKLHPIQKEKYTVSPYQIVVIGKWPSLICNNKMQNGLSRFRIDRITDIQMVNRYCKNMIEAGRYDMSTYMAEHSYMYSGNSVEVKFRIEKSMVGSVIDYFENCTFLNENEKYCDVKVFVNINDMLYWALNHGPDIEIIEPLTLRKKIGNMAQMIANKYRNCSLLKFCKLLFCENYLRSSNI